MTYKLKVAYTKYKVYELEDIEEITVELLEKIIKELEEDNYFPWTYDKCGAGPSRDPIRIYTTHEALKNIKRSINYMSIHQLPEQNRLANNQIGAWFNICFFDDSNGKNDTI